MATPLPSPILFYDGTCGLCHRAVRWTLRHDRRQVFRFAPLQGTTYAGLVDAAKPTELSTLVVRDESGLHTRSAGTLAILRICGGGWRVLAGAIWCVPRPLRDRMYDVMARRRFSWWGREDSCTLPAPADHQRFLP